MRINLAVLSVLDSKNREGENLTNNSLEKIAELKHPILEKKFVENDKSEIKNILQNWIKIGSINVIIIVGGIEVNGEGIVPEILNKITDKNLPTFEKLTEEINIKTRAFLANKKFIFSLPKSENAVTDICERIFKYHLDMNYVTFLNFNANKRVTPAHLFYGQLLTYRMQDMKNELNKQIEFYLSNSKIDLNERKRKFILVEIGTYLGESLELWGDILEQKLENNFLIISIDPYKYYASKADADYFFSKKENSKVKSTDVVKMSENIKKIYMYFVNNISIKKWKNKHIHLRMDSKEALNILQNFGIKIDFCYIDGSHYYEDYKFDLENYYKILKFEDGYYGKICGDDFELSYDELLISSQKKDLDKILSENKNTDFLMLDKFKFHPGITLAMNETKIKIKKYQSGFWSADN